MFLEGKKFYSVKFVIGEEKLDVKKEIIKKSLLLVLLYFILKYKSITLFGEKLTNFIQSVTLG